MGEFLIRSTAILAVACYVGRIMIDVLGWREDHWPRRARGLWTVGGMALLTHVGCAFHFPHDWSQAAAWEHTRQRTLELTGWDSGLGLMFNEVMTVLWLIDVAGWRLLLEWPRRYRAWYWTVQCFFAFMMINATAVFGPWYWAPVWAGTIIGSAIIRHHASTRHR